MYVYVLRRSESPHAGYIHQRRRPVWIRAIVSIDCRSSLGGSFFQCSKHPYPAQLTQRLALTFRKLTVIYQVIWIILPHQKQIMKAIKITYWVTTAIVSLMMAFSAYAYLTQDAMRQAFHHLGY